MNCPVCDGNAELLTDELEIKYRGDNYIITAYCYACNKCGTEFTTTDSDTNTMSDLREQYKIRRES